MKPIHQTFAAVGGLALLATSAVQGADIPDPDGKPADMTKPVQVFILMGQSNMVGAGKVKGDKEGTLEFAVKNENLYPFLVDDAGAWTTRQDVRYVRYMTGRMLKNDWMSVSEGKIGPELGIGAQLGTAMEEPVMVLKSCIGNRSLGWDLLPPGSKGYDFTETDKKTGKEVTYTYAGYKESPLRWEKGSEPEPIGWYAGKQWDTDIADAKKVLEDFNTYYPDAKGYEVAGFFYWQGDKDRYNLAHATKYEENLVNFIKALRETFDAPDAKFVCATLGQAEKGKATGNDALILEAQLAVDGESGKHPEFKGNVATVYTNPISQGGASNGHYGGNAKTYMDVGLAMGEAMVKLLKD
ncbi:hypothetical protein HAHE_06940 [Haloferula helveola]|uniref:Sialate O-acetylesterase domain-containing protein n=1 Tax=Haloferula helveola TaxID=490095 RepID=A0ABM7R9K7_9BACT|nr:hypothetical protein HAHE_06940 [Haloferula helveola]